LATGNKKWIYRRLLYLPGKTGLANTSTWYINTKAVERAINRKAGGMIIWGSCNRSYGPRKSSIAVTMTI